MRLRLKIAYDGRPHAGWQSQSCGNTVQDILAAAIERVAKCQVPVHGSGRTDAGVHALGQIAHFDAPAGISMNPFNWVPALNTKLPPSIRVMECVEVSAGFHARFGAKGKVYHYLLSCEPVLSPFRAGLVWHLPRGLDGAELQKALCGFQGRHDFHGFAAYRGNEGPDMDWCRTIHRAVVFEEGMGYRIEIEGDGFLYKMVRLMVGGAVHAAQGRMSIPELRALLDQADGLPGGKSPLCAPPDGLYLHEVLY